MDGSALAMSRRRRAVRWVAWLGALAIAVTFVMGVAHASGSASAAFGTHAAPAAHAMHGADATTSAAPTAAAAQESSALGDAATCATCGPHEQGAAFACMLLIIVAALAAVLPRAPLTWVMGRVSTLRRVMALRATVPAAPNLTALGISRT